MSLGNKYCDLHTHSTASDGSYSPEEIVIAAKELGIAVALTDHNTTVGLPEFIRAAEKHGVEAVPGVEISCDYNGAEIHLLGLFVRESSFGKIEDLMRPIRDSKNINNRELVQRLAADGYVVDIDRIIAEKGDGYVNRVDIAHEMVRLGYASDVRDAFVRYLEEGGKYYIPNKKISVMDMIDFLVSEGVLPVIAHPYLSLGTEVLDVLIPEAKALGLAGMETSYSKYSPETQAEAEATALRHGILMSGGSDFHGKAKPEISLMSGKGDLRVPYEYYLKLKEYADR